ncbi:MAG TPA: hypothetical protein VJT73_15970, partial [Polyangiaceae bacterium]|nr:hypothetical protein [Polyangiaceae bacterium]
NRAIDDARWGLATIRAVRWIYRALTVLAIVVVFVRMRRGDRERDGGPKVRERAAAALPVFCIVVAYAGCMMVLLRVAGPMSVGDRHTAGLVVPAIFAAMALPTAALDPWTFRGWALFLVASNISGTALTLAVPLAKDCDCRRVARTIESLEAKEEPILVFPSEDAMPLGVYYRGMNRLVPVPRPASLEHWDQATFVLDDPDEIAALLDQGRHGALWVHTNTYGTGWGGEKLEQFLARGYRQDETHSFFHGVTLRHFVRDGSVAR